MTGRQDAILFWMHNGLTEAQARTQAAAEAYDSLAAANDMPET